MPEVFTAVNYPVGTNPIALATGDLNHDGIPDLAVANLTSKSVSQLPGIGDGTFGAASTTVLSGQPIAVIAADFNGDGRCDLAVSEDKTGVDLALSRSGGFATNFVLYGVGDPAGMAAADFHTGRGLDLAVVSAGEGGYVGSVSVLLGNYGSAVRPPGTLPNESEMIRFAREEIAAARLADKLSVPRRDFPRTVTTCGRPSISNPSKEL